MPERLLSLLSDLPQTGDALGARLGLGRVSVNTLARKLADSGVPVQISRAGYALPPGTPTPALTTRPGPLGTAMRYVGSVGSTQDEARAWADDPVDPAPHGAVVVADSLHVVVAKAYYLNVNARLQLQAMQLHGNGVVGLSAEEARKAAQTYERSWESWKSSLPTRP